MIICWFLQFSLGDSDFLLILSNPREIIILCLHWINTKNISKQYFGPAFKPLRDISKKMIHLFKRICSSWLVTNSLFFLFHFALHKSIHFWNGQKSHVICVCLSFARVKRKMSNFLNFSVLFNYNVSKFSMESCTIMKFYIWCTLLKYCSS